MFKDEVCDLVQIDLARVRTIRSELVTPDAVQGLADTFSALGDPTRVRILDALSHGELCVCDLAAVLGVSQSAVSHQLRLLRGIRLVKPRREGRIVFYSLDDQHIISIFKQTLQHVEEGAQVRGAQVRGARVRGAQVRGAQVRGARVPGARVR
jgi:ArsR family transcriptional regulator